MSFDSLLAEAAECGYLVNNLYQLDSGTWRCNLRRGDNFTDVATATTACGALHEALNLLDTAEPSQLGTGSASIEATKSLASILTKYIPIVDRRL